MDVRPGEYLFLACLQIVADDSVSVHPEPEVVVIPPADGERFVRGVSVLHVLDRGDDRGGELRDVEYVYAAAEGSYPEGLLPVVIQRRDVSVCQFADSGAFGNGAQVRDPVVGCHRLGGEGDQAVVSSDPDRAVAVFDDRHDLDVVHHGVADAHHGAVYRSAEQPVVCPDPHGAAPSGAQGIDRCMLHGETGEFAVLQVIDVYSVVPCPDPQIIVRILAQGDDVFRQVRAVRELQFSEFAFGEVVCPDPLVRAAYPDRSLVPAHQQGGDIGDSDLLTVGNENGIALVGVDVQPVGGPDPYVAVLHGQQALGVFVRNAPGSGIDGDVHRHVAVVAGDAVGGSDPHAAERILRNGEDRVAQQTLFRIDYIDDHRCASGEGEFQKNGRKEEDDSARHGCFVFHKR